MGNPNEAVTLKLPARPEMLALIRIAVGAMAANLDMTIDEIADLQLAVEELVMGCVARNLGLLDLVIEPEGDTLRVECSCEEHDISAATDDLSRQILDALVDDHGVLVRDDRHVSWLVKRLAPRPDQP